MISIVVRTRNEAHWIERCLAAIALQDLQEWEVVLVDNASTDGTPGLASRFGCRVLNISAHTFSYGRAINVGVRAARGVDHAGL